jgi:hypothetical protein
MALDPKGHPVLQELYRKRLACPDKSNPAIEVEKIAAVERELSDCETASPLSRSSTQIN